MEYMQHLVYSNTTWSTIHAPSGKIHFEDKKSVSKGVFKTSCLHADTAIWSQIMFLKCLQNMSVDRFEKYIRTKCLQKLDTPLFCSQSVLKVSSKCLVSKIWRQSVSKCPLFWRQKKLGSGLNCLQNRGQLETLFPVLSPTLESHYMYPVFLLLLIGCIHNWICQVCFYWSLF